MDPKVFAEIWNGTKYEEVKQYPFEEYITAEEYTKLSYEEYKIQCELKLRLRQSATISAYYKSISLRDVLDKLFSKGVYLVKEEKRYKMIPIIGQNFWSAEEYSEYRTKLKKNIKVIKAMIELTGKLTEVHDKTMCSISCENRRTQCDKIHTDCYFSKCEIGRQALETNITKKSEKLKSLQLSSA